mmetsp:Transcript_19646/g.40773  ORF Transcript_19646/g.40773 Transcript_19646/m.40773 type:complete len:94 (-) Transcript_19646:3711-3992(-)
MFLIAENSEAVQSITKTVCAREETFPTFPLAARNLKYGEAKWLVALNPLFLSAFQTLCSTLWSTAGHIPLFWTIDGWSVGAETHLLDSEASQL